MNSLLSILTQFLNFCTFTSEMGEMNLGKHLVKCIPLNSVFGVKLKNNSK